MFHRRACPATWLISALTLGLLAITLPLAARGLYGPSGALVHVRWQSSVDAAERQRLEAAWQLVDGEEVSPATWRYDLTAPAAGQVASARSSSMRPSPTPITSTGSGTPSRPRQHGPPDATA